MNRLWTFLEEKPWTVKTKYTVVLLLLSVISALIGYVVWMIIKTWILSTTDWMICFIGYPIFISWIVVFFYSCKHDFHNNLTK